MVPQNYRCVWNAVYCVTLKSQVCTTRAHQAPQRRYLQGFNRSESAAARMSAHCGEPHATAKPHAPATHGMAPIKTQSLHIMHIRRRCCRAQVKIPVCAVLGTHLKQQSSHAPPTYAQISDQHFHPVYNVLQSKAMWGMCRLPGASVHQHMCQ